MVVDKDDNEKLTKSMTRTIDHLELNISMIFIYQPQIICYGTLNMDVTGQLLDSFGAKIFTVFGIPEESIT